MRTDGRAPQNAADADDDVSRCANDTPLLTNELACTLTLQDFTKGRIQEFCEDGNESGIGIPPEGH